jgi:hypothetical protein
MTTLTRLEKLLFRLEAQHVCLDWAFRDIAGRPGIVFEMGLGQGRTYDHLRTHLRDREIYVFDREVNCCEDCIPPADRMMLGEITETLTVAASRFGARVVLAHADMGTSDRAHNVEMSAKLARHLPPVLAPGAIVISDLPLELAGARDLPLPIGAREGRYYLYRNGLNPRMEQ